VRFLAGAGPRPDKGAAAVEFAIVAPLLVVLVVGIAEFGRAFFLQATLAGAAREGVRVMALQSDQSAARSAVRGYAPDLGISDGQIAIAPGSCPTGGVSPPPNATVTISYPLDFVTGFFGADLTLTGRGVMRCNG